MKKRIITALLSILIASGNISGCGNAEIRSNAQNTSLKADNSIPIESTTNNTGTAVSDISEVDINMDFNSSLIDFIEKYGFADKNYMISPTSFRAALALAVSGADSETKDELLKAMDFDSVIF